MKSKGAFLIARNNAQIDYVKQAVFLAKRVKKYLDIPTTVLTDSVDYLKTTYDETVFDRIIPLDYNPQKNERVYFDGALYQKQATFNNRARCQVYDLTPYDETVLLDTDYIVSNNLLKQCFNSQEDFLIYKESKDIAEVRDEQEFKYISCLLYTSDAADE